MATNLILFTSKSFFKNFILPFLVFKLSTEHKNKIKIYSTKRQNRQMCYPI